MVKLNHHYQKLKGSYLFPEIEKRVLSVQEKNPTASLLHLGIGDIKKPIPKSAAIALQEASLEMGAQETFKGYGPSKGYSFLREAISQNDYQNLKISPEEIFISNGTKCDIANFQEIFDVDNRVALSDPTYPVYLESNIMAGRTKLLLKSGNYGGVTYLDLTEKNGFQPLPPRSHVDLVYLCSPNNPTGVALQRDVLKLWVEYAQKEGAILIFDGAYEAFIQSENTPHSIYEIEGAKEVAVEMRSFSKSAGFTGLRCSYTVVPFELKVKDAGRVHSLFDLWTRRHDTKFNGVPYPIQKAALALYSEVGKKEQKAFISEYQTASKFLLNGLKNLGCKVFGGIDAPYLWWKTPNKIPSWDFFDLLLNQAKIITTPGKGFGLQGEYFVRLSAFQEISKLEEALERLQKIL